MFIGKQETIEIQDSNLAGTRRQQLLDLVNTPDPDIWNAQGRFSNDLNADDGYSPYQNGDLVRGADLARGNIYSYVGNDGTAPYPNPDTERDALTDGSSTDEGPVSQPNQEQSRSWQFIGRSNLWSIHQGSAVRVVTRGESLSITAATMAIVDTITLINCFGASATIAYQESDGAPVTETKTFPEGGNVSFQIEVPRTFLPSVPEAQRLVITVNNPGGRAGFGQVVLSRSIQLGNADLANLILGVEERSELVLNTDGTTGVQVLPTLYGLQVTTRFDVTEIPRIRALLKTIRGGQKAIFSVFREGDSGTLTYGFLKRAPITSGSGTTEGLASARIEVISLE